MKSGCGSLVDHTVAWVHNLDSAPNDGSNEYLKLAKGRKLRPADHFTRHVEGRRRCFGGKKMAYFVYTLSYDVETALIGKNLQFAIFYAAQVVPSDQWFGRGCRFRSIMCVVRRGSLISADET